MAERAPSVLSTREKKTRYCPHAAIWEGLKFCLFVANRLRIHDGLNFSDTGSEEVQTGQEASLSRPVTIYTDGFYFLI